MKGIEILMGFYKKQFTRKYGGSKFMDFRLSKIYLIYNFQYFSIIHIQLYFIL